MKLIKLVGVVILLAPASQTSNITLNSGGMFFNVISSWNHELFVIMLLRMIFRGDNQRRQFLLDLARGNSTPTSQPFLSSAPALHLFFSYNTSALTPCSATYSVDFCLLLKHSNTSSFLSTPALQHLAPLHAPKICV